MTSSRTNEPRVAVVGAGLAGLTCARILTDNGYDVTVFEKSRGVGGRMSTRRATDDLQFDHGAQYFTVRDHRFIEYVERWLEVGIVEEWKARIAVIGRSAAPEYNDGPKRYVAVPGMNGICKHLAANLRIEFTSRVQPIVQRGNGWELVDEAGHQLGQFDLVVVSAPAEQTAAIVERLPALAQTAQNCEMQPCWATMLAFESTVELPYDAAFVHNSPLSWIARNSSKPQRTNVETWVLHATPTWSRERDGAERDEIASELFNAFKLATGVSGLEPIHSVAHFWRYAIPPEPLHERFLLDENAGVVVCGDWCAGARVEGAFLSGSAAGDRILKMHEDQR